MFRASAFLVFSAVASTLAYWTYYPPSAAAASVIERPAAMFSPARAATGYVYAANQNANTITAYPATAAGNVRPAFTIAGPHTRLVQPSALAHDRDGRLYVVSGNNEILIFARGARGDATPIRSFSASYYSTHGITTFVYPTSVAVDGNGYTYVGVSPVNFGDQDAIVLFGPAARDAAVPLRAFAFGDEGAPEVAVNALGEVYEVVPWDRYNGWILSKYAGFASGNAYLSSPLFGQVDLLSSGGVAVNPRTGEIYALNRGNSQLASIVAFDPAFKNRSLRIRGIGTGLGAYPRGIAVDSAGQTYVGQPNAPLPNSVEIFAAGARGNVAPIRTISGPNTGLNLPVAVTVIE